MRKKYLFFADFYEYMLDKTRENVESEAVFPRRDYQFRGGKEDVTKVTKIRGVRSVNCTFVCATIFRFWIDNPWVGWYSMHN